MRFSSPCTSSSSSVPHLRPDTHSLRTRYLAAPGLSSSRTSVTMPRRLSPPSSSLSRCDSPSPTFRSLPLLTRDRADPQEECLPAEKLFHAQVSTDPAKRWKQYPQVIEDLKAKAKQRGLWQLWMNKAQYGEHGGRLSNLEYSVMAEVMGHAIRIAPEATNSSAPDTGNMGALAASCSSCRDSAPGFETDLQARLSASFRFSASSRPFCPHLPSAPP